MRLINIDEFAASCQNGKTAVMKMLDKWEKENPVNRILVEEAGEFDVYLVRKGTPEAEELRRKCHG